MNWHVLLLQHPALHSIRILRYWLSTRTKEETDSSVQSTMYNHKLILTIHVLNSSKQCKYTSPYQERNKNIYNNISLCICMAQLKSEEEGEVSRAYHDYSNYKLQCLREPLQAIFYFWIHVYLIGIRILELISILRKGSYTGEILCTTVLCLWYICYLVTDLY